MHVWLEITVLYSNAPEVRITFLAVAHWRGGSPHIFRKEWVIHHSSAQTQRGHSSEEKQQKNITDKPQNLRKALEQIDAKL